MIGLPEIQAAARRIHPHIRHTPLLRCRELEEEIPAELYCKCEHLQAAAAFKTRGACNAVFSLADHEAQCGVVTHSSGNHAAALARAARRRGVVAHIVMPRSSRQQKVDAVREFGGEIRFCEPTLAAREAMAEEVMEETGATFIHPYDDDRIIAGQGTAALEMLQRCPDLDVLVTPVGGGGLLSGTALCAKALNAGSEVWAGEPQGADDAYRSWKSGTLVPSTSPRTIADGLLTSLGKRNFKVIQNLVDDIRVVSEASIVRGVRFLYERMDFVVEPSAAVALAAVMEDPEAVRGKKIGIILSGGNFDLEDLPP